MSTRYNVDFKLEVVKAYMNGDRSMSELSADCNVAKSTITGWIKNMVKNAHIKLPQPIHRLNLKLQRKSDVLINFFMKKIRK
jgi:transposase-like protein